LEESTNVEGPWLWNPDVAALLSWLGFTSFFGAIVHAANWRRLGQRRKMWASLAWAAALPVSMFVAGVVAGHIKLRDAVVPLTFAVTFLNIIAWYFLSGRRQSKYIVIELKSKYRRDSWVVPVLVALIVLFSLRVFGVTG
jgi:hypothetical protein